MADTSSRMDTRDLSGIAVVGMAGRFPGAKNCQEFWDNLIAGRETLTVFTPDDIAAAGVALPEHHDQRVRARGVVAGSDQFDAGFFGLSPKEAEMMDPQQRVFLELAWEALEHAGYDPDRPPGPVGVFAGAGINTYYPNNISRRPDALDAFGIFPAVVLNEKDFIATRVAYKLNLRGPALTVQTACSTSLVAVCSACQSLLNYECDVALAGGVMLNFPSCHSVIHEEGGMISKDGHCRPFDKTASGTLFSDGAGVVALRRLEDAVAAGDTVLAVIKGFALNNDGSDKAGYTAPSVNGQARVIQMAQSFGNIPPETITYVEAHGTATPLGDPIEIAALTQAFRAGTKAKQFCAIGSVKSNIGHLDVAAGVAGLIKAVLALQHRKIPPTINFTGPNPKIDFASSPFYVADRLIDWTPAPGAPRRAAVSSFGIGGTNAHVVLEEAPAPEPSTPSRRPQLLVLSARSAAAVDAASARLAEHLRANPGTSLADVAHTLQTGRHVFTHRRVVVATDAAQALERLQATGAAAQPTLTPLRRNPPVVFMFPGQGAQRVNMGRELYENEPVFRDVVDRCATTLRPELGLDLREILYPSPERTAWAEEQIVQTRITQPALFVTEYALASLWMSWGVAPAAMIGHSVGEYVAACLAGVFALEDGLRLIAARGRMIQEQPAGTMLAVMAPEADVVGLLGNELSIAAVNAPSLCVASGPEVAIAALEKELGARKVGTRRLHTSHAFHSAMLEPVVAPFTALLATVKLSAPKLPYVSNVTGTWITNEQATDPVYWARHLRQAVRFADGVGTLLTRTEQVLLEVGPGATLTTLARQHTARNAAHVIQASLPGGRDAAADTAALLAALGRLWQAGVEVDWSVLHRGETRRRVPLPTYPFERKRHFIEPDLSRVAPARASAAPAAAAEATPVATIQPAASAVTASADEPRREAILRRLTARLTELSGLSAGEISASAGFLEMGFDSLFLSRVSRAFEIEFGQPITFRQLAGDLPTLAAVAGHLDAALPQDWKAADAVHAPSAASASSTALAPHQPASSAPAGGGELAAIRAQLDAMSRQIERLTQALLGGASEIAVPAVAPTASQRPATEIVLPMTEAQREIWLASQLGADVSRTYNEAYVVRARGPLRREALATALQDLVDRHDALRTTFAADGSNQRIAPSLSVNLEYADLSAAPASLDAAVAERTAAVFDCERGPLFRFALLQTGPDEQTLLLVIHHLVADGWSWAVLLEELGGLYRARAAGAVPEPSVAPQYQDYVSWLAEPAHVARAQAAESYWVKLLEDRPEEIELPFDRPRPPRKTYRAGQVHHRLSAATTARLRDAARSMNCTPFHLLKASFDAWIHRVTGRTELVVGVPTAGQISAGLRDHTHVERLVGHCVNMLPVRTRCTGSESFRDFVAHVRSVLFDARDNQDVSFNVLTDKLAWPRDPSKIPMASVSFNLGRVHPVAFGLDIASTTTPAPKAWCFFDLTADVIEAGEELLVDCKFNLDLCDAATVARWLSQWERLLTAGIATPDAAITALECIPEAEKHQLLVTWNSTEREYPREARLHDLVEAQVARTPDAAAVQFEGATLTYAELDARANRLARRLVECAVGPDVLVAICLERSADMIVAMLAVLKAGGAYVPLDPAYPKDRVAYVLEDSHAAVLITENAILANLDARGARTICLDRDRAAIDALPAQPLPARSSATNLAYVIYTSGSTGRPKGVQIEHRAAVNFMLSMQREPGISAQDTLLAVTTLAFDIAGLEVFLPLISGARIVVAPRSTAIDGFDLVRRVDELGVTVLQATPATWRLMLAAGWTGRRGLKILCGGEPLPRDLAAELLPRCASLWNMYGPTETTIWSTCCRVEDAGDIHIGRPIDNTTLRIVDSSLNPVPVGVAGELLIGGDGLARGYLRRPELTAERFITLPSEPGIRYYRTGDLAKYRPDGNVACLGRLDFQVKIRGHRIELGEIEATLVQLEDIESAVVVAMAQGSDERMLAAYCVPRRGRQPNVARLREHLASQLPEYMIPAAFAFLERLPTTPNGKIDRKSLPAIETDATAVEASAYMAPRTPMETSLCEVFQEVLGATRVGVNDDFFRLGGRSLEAVRAISRIREVLGQEVPVALLFEAPTPAEASLRLVAAQASSIDDAELARMLAEIEADKS